MSLPLHRLLAGVVRPVVLAALLAAPGVAHASIDVAHDLPVTVCDLRAGPGGTCSDAGTTAGSFDPIQCDEFIAMRDAAGLTGWKCVLVFTGDRTGAGDVMVTACSRDGGSCAVTGLPATSFDATTCDRFFPTFSLLGPGPKIARWWCYALESAPSGSPSPPGAEEEATPSGQAIVPPPIVEAGASGGPAPHGTPPPSAPVAPVRAAFASVRGLKLLRLTSGQAVRVACGLRAGGTATACRASLWARSGKLLGRRTVVLAQGRGVARVRLGRVAARGVRRAGRRGVRIRVKLEALDAGGAVVARRSLASSLRAR